MYTMPFKSNYLTVIAFTLMFCIILSFICAFTINLTILKKYHLPPLPYKMNLWVT